MKSFKVALAVVLTMVASSAFAGGWEISAGTGTSNVGPGPLGSAAVLNVNPTSSFAFSLNGSVGYMLGSGIQAVLAPQVTISTAAAPFTTTLLGGAVGPRFNLSMSDKIKDDFYVFPYFKLLIQAAGTSTTTVGIGAQIGKRFAITDAVAFTPNVGFDTTFSPSPTSLGFYATVVSFSLFL